MIMLLLPRPMRTMRMPMALALKTGMMITSELAEGVSVDAHTKGAHTEDNAGDIAQR